MKIKCPACGFENEEGSKFCSSCGESISKQKTPKECITEQRKKEIQEEEKIRINQRNDEGNKNLAQGCGCFIVVIIIFLILNKIFRFL